jgi:hypothetical protein
MAGFVPTGVKLSIMSAIILRAARLLVWPIVFVASAFAQAPDSLAGLTFTQSGSTIARTSYQREIAFLPDGTFHGVFSAGTLLAEFILYNQAPIDGTWTYRRLDSNRGEITLVPANPDSILNGRRILEFATASDGKIDFTTLPSFIGAANFHVASQSERAPLLNCSNRSFVRAGGNALTGFVISGSSPRNVLIRAIGPGLTPFGVTSTLIDPKFVLTANGRIIAENDNWDGTNPLLTTGAESVRRANALVGAFSLAAGAKDSAIVVQLNPGAYVTQVSSPSPADSGEVLVEVYVLP